MGDSSFIGSPTFSIREMIQKGTIEGTGRK